MNILCNNQFTRSSELLNWHLSTHTQLHLQALGSPQSLLLPDKWTGKYTVRNYIIRYITMTSQWTWWRLKSPVSELLTQPFIQGQIKKTARHRVTGHCAGNSPVTGEFPAQRASNAENVSPRWSHHEKLLFIVFNIVLYSTAIWWIYILLERMRRYTPWNLFLYNTYPFQ